MLYPHRPRSAASCISRGEPRQGLTSGLGDRLRVSVRMRSLGGISIGSLFKLLPGFGESGRLARSGPVRCGLMFWRTLDRASRTRALFESERHLATRLKLGQGAGVLQRPVRRRTEGGRGHADRREGPGLSSLPWLSNLLWCIWFCAWWLALPDETAHRILGLFVRLRDLHARRQPPVSLLRYAAQGVTAGPCRPFAGGVTGAPEFDSRPDPSGRKTLGITCRQLL